MSSIVENKKKHALSLLLIAGLMAATCFFLFKDHELTDIIALIRNANTNYLFLGVGVMILFFAMEALSLKTLMRPFGYQISFRRCYCYSLVDFYFSSITPGCCGGQPSQIYYMNRDNIPISVSSLVLLLFNLAYHIAMLFLVFTTLAIGGAGLLTSLGPIRFFFFYGVAAQVFLVFAFVTAVFSKRLMPIVVGKVVRLLVKLHMVKDQEKVLATVQVHVAEYQQGAAYIKKNPQILVKVVFFALLHLAFYYSIPFWVYKAFHLSGDTLWMILAIQASLTLSFESLPIPGGVGVAESGFLLLYGSVFGPGLVVPAVLLCRGLNYYICLVTGGIVAAALHGKRRVITKKQASLERGTISGLT